MIDIDAKFLRYKELRRKGYSAENAARAVIQPRVAPAIDWMDGAASIEIAPYAVEVRQVYDPNPDLSWLGEYSGKPGPDAVARANKGRNEHPYWNPAIPLGEHFRSWRRLGYARADAWLKALECREQDYNRMEGFYRGDWTVLGIIAAARLDGIVCGEASLYGIESDSGDYLDELAHELARTAAHDADSHRDAMIRTRAEEIAALAAVPRQSV